VARRDSSLVQSVAQNIAARRRALGLTQEALADRLELAVKNVQRIEAGAQNLTLTTIERIAEALETPPVGLLGGITAEAAVQPKPSSASALDQLRKAGFAARGASNPGRRSPNAIPVTTVTAAAGALSGAARSLEVLGWVTLPRKGTPPEGQFVARVSGESMAPRVADGSLCLFGRAGPPPYGSRILLVSHGGISDSGLEGPIALKQISVRKRSGRDRVSLVSLNRDFPPIVLDASADEVQVVAELVDVLVPGRASPTRPRSGRR
jgi:transcriptional regulator with XRE-family HTH domain